MRRKGSLRWMVLLFLVLGIFTTIAASVSMVTAFAYRSASPCPITSPSADCLSTLSVRVAGVSYESTKSGGNRIVSFDPRSGLPTTYFDAHILGAVDVRAGDEVLAQLWRGKVTRISLNGRSYDSYNTQADSWIGLIAGLGLLLMGGWMWRMDRRRRRGEAAIDPANVSDSRPHDPRAIWWVRHANAIGGFGTVVVIGVITAILMATGHG